MTSKPVSLQLATYRTMGHGSPARTRRLVKDAPTRSVMSVSTMLRGKGGGELRRSGICMRSLEVSANVGCWCVGRQTRRQKTNAHYLTTAVFFFFLLSKGCRNSDDVSNLNVVSGSSTH